MNRFLKTIILITVTAICTGSMTGCGELAAELKIGREARYYVANKYGFRPGTTDVELQSVGELEGVWHKKDGGTATMEYAGHTFKVYVSLVDPNIRYDDYHMQGVQDYLTDYFSTALECNNIYVWATYGIPVCMVPSDVKTVEDIFEKCDNMKIYVSTFGLNRSSAINLDVTELGIDNEINIIDWSSEECLEDKELMRETLVGLETDSYTDGYSKLKSFYQFSEGNVSSLEK